MKTKNLFMSLALLSLSITVANAKDFSPVTSPTFPGKYPENSIKSFSPTVYETPWELKLKDFESVPMPDNMKSTQKAATIDDIEASPSTQMVLKGKNGKVYFFTQFKKVDGSYSVIMPQRFYAEMTELGYSFDGQDIRGVSDDEYQNTIKDVKLVVFGKEPLIVEDKYFGGEGGRCAAGTVGGAIGGGLAGAAVGGPAGAVVGAIGGALVGSAASCR